MIVRLRDGDESAPLFLFPGTGADPRELSSLAQSIRSRRAMLGVELLDPAAHDHGPVTVASIAEACVREIRTVQNNGPYCLAGYSFGGLVAIEVARLLRDAGHHISLLALIDTIPDPRSWPRGMFLMAQARRASWHAQRIARLRASDAIREVSYRLRRLRSRFRSRRDPVGQAQISPEVALKSPQNQCEAALRCYVPAHYSGTLTVFSAEDEEFACDPARLWRLFADTVEQRSIPGSHLGIVRDMNAISRLAAALENYLHDV
jgi:acetoacetyl-CoA synthetase